MGKPKKDDPEQSKRFEETAKEREADESGKKFEKLFKDVATPNQPTRSRGGS